MAPPHPKRTRDRQAGRSGISAFGGAALTLRWLNSGGDGVFAAMLQSLAATAVPVWPGKRVDKETVVS
jgi:hypothetical protein